MQDDDDLDSDSPRGRAVGRKRDIDDTYADLDEYENQANATRDFTDSDEETKEMPKVSGHVLTLLEGGEAARCKAEDEEELDIEVV